MQAACRSSRPCRFNFFAASAGADSDRPAEENFAETPGADILAEARRSGFDVMGGNMDEVRPPHREDPFHGLSTLSVVLLCLGTLGGVLACTGLLSLILPPGEPYAPGRSLIWRNREPESPRPHMVDLRPRPVQEQAEAKARLEKDAVQLSALLKEISAAERRIKETAEGSEERRQAQNHSNELQEQRDRLTDRLFKSLGIPPQKSIPNPPPRLSLERPKFSVPSQGSVPLGRELPP